MTKSIEEAIASVFPGDIVLIGSSYFWVVDVRDPTDPRASGVVWEGHWFQMANGFWGNRTIVHMHAGKPYPHRLSPEDRKSLGWGDL